MPRKAREKSSTGIYHMILRGVNRQIIFESREDGEKFLQTLKEYKDKSKYNLYGYCLMNNHIHLLIKENEEDLGMIMRRIGASYVYWYNWKYERVGHLFQDRYKSEVVEDERYLLNVLRYIHQNPIKAGVVDDIKKYRWSSYLSYTDESKETLVDINFILGIFNKDRKKAIKEFEKFHEVESKDRFLDIDEQLKRRIKDSDGSKIIKEMCKIKNCSDLKNMDSLTRNIYLDRLKKEGLSTRQIERLTGISRHIILKA